MPDELLARHGQLLVHRTNGAVVIEDERGSIRLSAERLRWLLVAAGPAALVRLQADREGNRADS